MPHLIRVSSRATGERRFVRVYIYDTVEEMRDAATRFNPGHDFSDAGGVTQGYCTYQVDGDGGMYREVQELIIVRMHRGALGTTVVSHEMNHAAVAIYGSTLDPDVRAIDVLDQGNETLAYLQSDLTGRLVNRLYALGYYG